MTSNGRPATLEIVLAFYNGGQYIKEQVSSIIESAERTDLDWQIHIIDDFSVADQSQILTEVSGINPRIKVTRNPKNLGVIETFSFGLSVSKADYVMLSDQDDKWLPAKIEKSIGLLRSIEGDQPALVFTDLCVVDDRLNTNQSHMLNLRGFKQNSSKFPLLFQNVVAGCTIAVNRRLLNLAVPIPRGVAMHDHWLALCAAFAGRIAYLSEPTILYRQHSLNSVGSPKRRLIYRLSRPFETIGKLNTSLTTKAEQTELLLGRLQNQLSPPDQTNLRSVVLGFKTRNIANLLSLIRTGVFRLDPMRFVLTCLAYLLTRCVP